MIILGPKTAILGPQFCKILVLGPIFGDQGEGLRPQAPWILPCLTLRETEQIIDVQKYMDVEVEIRGFNSPNITTYITQSFGRVDECDDLLKQAESSGLWFAESQDGYSFVHNFLQIPIFLNMICVIFKCKLTLPNTKTGIMECMIKRYMTREANKVDTL